MTNRAAVIAEVEVSVPISDNVIEKALIDLAIDGDATYTSSNAIPVASAALKVLQKLLSLKSIKEGGYAIELQINQRIASIAEENGLEVASFQPKVRARDLW